LPGTCRGIGESGEGSALLVLVVLAESPVSVDFAATTGPLESVGVFGAWGTLFGSGAFGTWVAAFGFAVEFVVFDDVSVVVLVLESGAFAAVVVVDWPPVSVVVWTCEVLFGFAVDSVDDESVFVVVFSDVVFCDVVSSPPA
jgi:hypothetical protein